VIEAGGARSVLDQAPAQELPLDAVVTHHRDGYRSGVGRFDELLAEHLGVPLLSLEALVRGGPSCPLLSFKASELSAARTAKLEELLRAKPFAWEAYLHVYGGLELERIIVQGAQRVHCGNHEISQAVQDLNGEVTSLWTPGLIQDARQFRPSEVSVFSFGMAHKIRTDLFKRLRALLDASEHSYAVYVSAANHETVRIRDAALVYDEMKPIFPQELYFLGNLSDVAVYNYLISTTFFAAFFSGGVRANNTTVAAAMERGAVVITNLDEHSPPEFVHMDNVIDIERCEALPLDPLVLKRLSTRAMETGRQRGWDALVEQLVSFPA
jgi:hypothetical protein